MILIVYIRIKIKTECLIYNHLFLRHIVYGLAKILIFKYDMLPLHFTKTLLKA